jgi:tetrahydromethanopterin S-methyltransferase subunit G
MEKKLGEKIGLLWKILIGFSLMIFVLTLIAGPILLFS